MLPRTRIYPGGCGGSHHVVFMFSWERGSTTLCMASWVQVLRSCRPQNMGWGFPHEAGRLGERAKLQSRALSCWGVPGHTWRLSALFLPRGCHIFLVPDQGPSPLGRFLPGPKPLFSPDWLLGKRRGKGISWGALPSAATLTTLGNGQWRIGSKAYTCNL